MLLFLVHASLACSAVLDKLSTRFEIVPTEVLRVLDEFMTFSERFGIVFDVVSQTRPKDIGHLVDSIRGKSQFATWRETIADLRDFNEPEFDDVMMTSASLSEMSEVFVDRFLRVIREYDSCLDQHLYKFMPRGLRNRSSVYYHISSILGGIMDSRGKVPWEAFSISRSMYLDENLLLEGSTGRLPFFRGLFNADHVPVYLTLHNGLHIVPSKRLVFFADHQGPTSMWNAGSMSPAPIPIKVMSMLLSPDLETVLIGDSLAIDVWKLSTDFRRPIQLEPFCGMWHSLNSFSAGYPSTLSNMPRSDLLMSIPARHELLLRLFSAAVEDLVDDFPQTTSRHAMVVRIQGLIQTGAKEEAKSSIVAFMRGRGYNRYSIHKLIRCMAAEQPHASADVEESWEQYT